MLQEEKYKPIRMCGSENEFFFDHQEEHFYVKCVRYKMSTLVNVNVINKMISNTYNFRHINLILCTENDISKNASKKIDDLARTIYVTNCNNLIRKIKSFA
jgi:hypothetical protein